jgi:hypothetical protein
LSDIFSIQNGLKRRDDLSPPIFNFALEFAVRKVHKTVVELKLRETCQPLVYADVNLLHDNINTTKRNTENLTEATKDV